MAHPGRWRRPAAATALVDTVWQTREFWAAIAGAAPLGARPVTHAAEQLHVSLLRNLTAFALRLPQSHVLLSNTSYEGDTMYADVMVLSAWALSPRFEALVYGDAEEEDLAGPNASAPAPRPPPVDAFDPLAPLAPPPPSELEVFAQLDAVPPPSGRAGYDADGRIIAALPPHNASAVGAVGAAGAGASSGGHVLPNARPHQARKTSAQEGGTQRSGMHSDRPLLRVCTKHETEPNTCVCLFGR